MGRRHDHNAVAPARSLRWSLFTWTPAVSGCQHQTADLERLETGMKTVK